MRIATPSSIELLLGLLTWVLVAVGSALAVAIDLRRRQVAAWWVASALTLLVLPFGLVAYLALRNPRLVGSGRRSR